MAPEGDQRGSPVPLRSVFVETVGPGRNRSDEESRAVGSGARQDLSLSAQLRHLAARCEVTSSRKSSTCEICFEGVSIWRDVQHQWKAIGRRVPQRTAPHAEEVTVAPGATAAMDHTRALPTLRHRPVLSFGAAGPHPLAAAPSRAGRDRARR